MKSAARAAERRRLKQQRAREANQQSRIKKQEQADARQARYVARRFEASVEDLKARGVKLVGQISERLQRVRIINTFDRSTRQRYWEDLSEAEREELASLYDRGASRGGWERYQEPIRPFVGNYLELYS